MLVFSLTAALLCLFSMGTIKGTIQAQVMDESRRDFSSQISLAQKQLSSANLADSSQYQQLIGNLASRTAKQWIRQYDWRVSDER